MSMEPALVLMNHRMYGRLAAACLALPAAWANAMSQTVPGIRFSVDTSGTSVFSVLAGRVEFGAGRGRIDVAGIASRSARSINDVIVGPPSARPGDYYLFDTTGYVVVRPSTHTFSVVSFAGSTYRHGNVREPWDGYFEIGEVRREDVLPSDSLRLAQHGPFAVRWHLDRLMATRPAEILARGRVLVADAPRGEAGVVRWMANAPALAALRDTVTPLDSILQLTAVIVLPPQSKAASETNLILLHPMTQIRLAEIDVARMVLPPDYRETTFSGSEAVPSEEAAKHWRSVPPGKTRPSMPPNDR